MNKIRFLINSWWWQLRHRVYYTVVTAPLPIGDDDTANIQNTINKAAETPQWFTDIYEDYKSKWYRFFIKKPVLKATAKLAAGTYHVNDTIKMGDNINIEGL